MMEKTWISCNACGADSYRPSSMVGEWQIGQCLNCSLVYVNPIPFFEPTNEFSDISLEFEYTRYQSQQITPGILEFERNQLRRQFAKLAEFAGGEPRGRTLLEIGCGSGASVRAAVDLGWNAVGIDIDPQLIQLGRQQLNVDLRCTSLLDAGLEGGRFDFVRMRDVIEHLPNPFDSLKEIKRLLVPGGVTLIVTPNEGGLPSQVRVLMGKRDRVATVPPPHHLHGFTPQTMKRILERAGLRLHQMTTTTPIDAVYVTSNNMRSSQRRIHAAVWRTATTIGRGSVLVAWATA